MDAPLLLLQCDKMQNVVFITKCKDSYSQIHLKL